MKNKFFPFVSIALLVTVSFAITLSGCKKEENQNQLPTCNISYPQNGDIIIHGTSVTVSAEAEDSDGSIAEVNFYVDGVSKGSVSSFPYNYEWNTTDETTGNHIIKIIAYDNDGSTISNSVGVILTETVTDIDENIYKTVTIGTQVWMAENLKTTKYNDGTEIPHVSSDIDWFDLNGPAYAWYGNSPLNKDVYGALYNWYTVNTYKVCPTGWHVPTDDEWTKMENYLINNGYNFDGTTTDNKIAKAMILPNRWSSHTGTGTGGNTDYSAKQNVTGFSALPSGYRYNYGFFDYEGDYGLWWSATESDSSNAWHRILSYNNAAVIRYDNYKKYGYSVRCIKD
jgi:uncharacterized protein (TIGR02145 family)